MALKLDSKIPAGALADKWSNHKAAIKVVSPANKRKLDIIIVGTGLGGDSMGMSLSKQWEIVEDREASLAVVDGVTERWAQLGA